MKPRDFTDQQALDWIAQELRKVAGDNIAMQARLDQEHKMMADPTWSKLDGKFPVAAGARRAFVNLMEGLLA